MSLDKNGAQLKYGIIKHEDGCPLLSIPLAASQHIPAGGAFAKTDASGHAQVMGAGDALILGFIYPTETGLDKGQLYETTNAVAGVEQSLFIPANGMLSAVVRLPVGAGMFIQSMVGELCDLIVTSLNGNTYAQGAALNSNADNVVIIVGGDLINNAWVDVMVNPSKLTGQGNG